MLPLVPPSEALPFGIRPYPWCLPQRVRSRRVKTLKSKILNPEGILKTFGFRNSKGILRYSE